MEVRQRMEFTGTNSSIGLNALINYAHYQVPGFRCQIAGVRCQAELDVTPSHDIDRQRQSNQKSSVLFRHQLRVTASSQVLACFLTPDTCKLTPEPHLNHCFADLVVMAELLHPIPFRTRP